MTGKTFKDLNPKQIEALARKNRQASLDNMSEEMKKRGMTRGKKTDHAYVDRSKDSLIVDADHRSIFKEMKKPPYQD
jgi:hypothetical protein